MGLIFLISAHQCITLMECVSESNEITLCNVVVLGKMNLVVLHSPLDLLARADYRPP